MIRSTCARDIPNAKIIDTSNDMWPCKLCQSDMEKLAAMARGHCLTTEMARVRRLAVVALHAMTEETFNTYLERAKFAEDTFGVVISCGRIQT